MWDARAYRADEGERQVSSDSHAPCSSRCSGARCRRRKADARAAVTAHSAYGRRNGIALPFATIDGRFTGTSKAPFEQAYMQALFAHGERLGRDGAAFGGDPLGAPGGATVAER